MLGVARHVIQRGRGRAPCFSCAEDRLAYLELLGTFAAHYECAVHAYVLMANHVHTLMMSSAAGAAELARTLCERYQRYVAEKYGADGMVWDGNPEIRPVYARRYVLGCMRYIELNPVRAQIVTRPGDYRWSSYRSNALGHDDPVVTPHALYYALGRSADLRRRAYARFVHRGFAGPDTASP
ncbi:MAG: transposase [Burkholderiales bacterium]